VPPGNVELAFRLDGALRRLADPAGANRWLLHRWRGLATELVRDVEGAFSFVPGFRALCLGVGTRNPLAFPLLVGLTGASVVHALEPEARGDDWRTLWGLSETVIAVLSGTVDVPGLDARREAVARFVHLGPLLQGAPLAEVLTDALRWHGCGIEDAHIEGGVHLVTSRSVLEHLAEPARAVAALARLVPPGGVMHHDVDLSSHEADDPLALYRRPRGGNRGLDGLNGLRLSEWQTLLGDAGFAVTVLRTRRFEGTLAREAWAPRWADLGEDDLRTIGAVLLCRRG
jgi:hypothetical protein